MRIVFMGTPASAAASLETLLGGDHEVVGVVTQPDRPSGRGQTTTPSPVRRTAAERGIPVLTPQRMKDPGLLEHLRDWRPDLMVVVAYGRILPRTILDLAPLGCVNVHYSLLPRYRGAAPMQWAILQGEAVTGVTTMQLVAEMDAGPILLAQAVAMDPGETVTTLEARLVPVGARLLMETVAGLEQGALTPRPQDPPARHLRPDAQKGGRVDRLDPAGPGDRAAHPGLHPLALGLRLLAGETRQSPRRAAGGGRRGSGAGNSSAGRRGRHLGGYRRRRAAADRAATGRQETDAGGSLPSGRRTPARNAV